jgi:predicted nuclease of predicted toxin-antitoxin system
VFFIVDAQLPPALARWLASIGHEAMHVADIGMMASSDREIWDYAIGRSAVIITKDEDFVSMHSLHSEGARIVWVRIGNVRRAELLSWFERLMPVVVSSLDAGERLIEIA